MRNLKKKVKQDLTDKLDIDLKYDICGLKQQKLWKQTDKWVHMAQIRKKGKH